MFLRFRLVVAVAVVLCGCKPAAENRSKAILGAVLLDGNGGPPLSDSVVVIDGERIAAAGARSTIPVPEEADRINGAGKYIVPAPVDLCPTSPAPGMIRPATPEQARSEVAELVRRKAVAVHLGAAPPEAADAAIEAGRASGIPLLAHIAEMAEVRRLVDSGAAAFVGMIRDTEALDPDFLARLRTLRVVFAPALGGPAAGADIAARNTLRMFRAGVPLAMASEGRGVPEQMELMEAAGIPPLDVIAAASRAGAAVLGLADRGAILPGRRADLLLLTANPGENVAHLRQAALRMSAGSWLK